MPSRQTLTGVGVPSAEHEGAGRLARNLFGVGVGTVAAEGVGRLIRSLLGAGVAFGPVSVGRLTRSLLGVGVGPGEAEGAGRLVKNLAGVGVAGGEAEGVGRLARNILGYGVPSSGAEGVGQLVRSLLGAGVAPGSPGVGRLTRGLLGAGAPSAERAYPAMVLPRGMVRGFGVGSRESFYVGVLERTVRGVSAASAEAFGRGYFMRLYTVRGGTVLNSVVLGETNMDRFVIAGTRMRAAMQYTDALSGGPIDPPSVVLAVQWMPAGQPRRDVVYTFGVDELLVRDGPGQYRLLHGIDTHGFQGKIVVAWLATGGEMDHVGEDVVTVRPRS